MNDTITSGLVFIAVGALIFFAALCVAANTSLGGTRSDYDDGNGFWGGLGVFVFLAGVVTLIIGVLQ